eukprot:m.202043 g.202043  ORF g.202043 m.202043 type:complete len:90 (+) comp18432_c3_seq10:1232-1501(+)
MTIYFPPASFPAPLEPVTCTLCAALYTPITSTKVCSICALAQKKANTFATPVARKYTEVHLPAMCMLLVVVVGYHGACCDGTCCLPPVS